MVRKDYLYHDICLFVLDKYWGRLRLYTVWKFFVETASWFEEADVKDFMAFRGWRKL